MQINTKRALVATLGLYLSVLFFCAVLAVNGLLSMDSLATMPHVIWGWVLLAPFTLLWAKWYFKKDEPSLKKGLLLGLFLVVVPSLTDELLVVVALFTGGSTDFFFEIYSQWETYVTMIEIVLLTMFAGYEFDRTYTKG